MVNYQIIPIEVLSTDHGYNCAYTITQGDTNAYILKITYTDITEFDGTVTLRFTFPDGTYSDRENVVIDGNTITYTMDETDYSQRNVSVFVRHTDSTIIHTTLKIKFSNIRALPGNAPTTEIKSYPEWAADMIDYDIAVGTVETLAPGADATASITGDVPDKVLNLGIPQGATGDKGDTGDAATVAVGTVTTLDAGESATVANSGTSGAAVLDFGLPQGAKGDKGDPGLDGSAVPIDDASTAADRVLSASYIKGQLSAIEDRVVYIENEFPIDSRVFGVEFDTATTSPTLTRINDSVGKVANAGVGAQIVTNDFDALPIFGEMHEVTDSLGNVFVRIPKFYIFKSKGVKTVKKVSKYKWPGFYLPWCFWDFANNRELPYFDFGKYKAGNDESDRLTSKADEYPLVGQNIVTFRTRAQANGAGYQQLDIHAYDVLTTLMQIEFATLDMQSVMQGYTNGRYTATDLAQVTDSDTNRIIVTNAVAALYRVGQAISVGTSQGGNQVFYGRTITAIVEHDASNMAIEFDGSPVTITAGNVLYNTGYKNGFSAGITASSGSVVANDGKYPCSYRGIESPYGDVWQFVDGVNINDWQAWICDNADDYASNVFTNPYKQLSYINANADNYVTEMGLDASNPAVEFPSAVGAVGSSPYKDYYYQASGSRIALVGGYWINGSVAGPACWNLYYSTASADVRIGGRLCRKGV